MPSDPRKLTKKVRKLKKVIQKATAHSQGDHVCYLLQSRSKPSCSYIGYTNNLNRRIRQHNKEIKRGAKATSSKGPWNVVAWIDGFATRVQALQFEWAWKNAHKAKRFEEYFDEIGAPKKKKLVGARNRLSFARFIVQRFRQVTLTLHLEHALVS